jgi:hypothetical protein
MCLCIVTNFFTIKPNRCTNFPNLLRHDTLHVSGSSSAHHQEFIHCTLGTGVCHKVYRQLSSRAWSCPKAVYKPVWHIPVPSVKWIISWWWEEELPETCRVSCRSKFGKLVHLVGFIVKKKYPSLRVFLKHINVVCGQNLDLVNFKPGLHTAAVDP